MKETWFVKSETRLDSIANLNLLQFDQHLSINQLSLDLKLVEVGYIHLHGLEALVDDVYYHNIASIIGKQKHNHAANINVFEVQ